MKRAVFSGILAASFFVSSIASAAGWSGDVGVAKISSEDTGSGTKVYLMFTSSPMSTSCSLNSSGYWLAGSTTDNIERILAVAMSAKLSVRNVKVYWNGACSGGGSTGYPVASGLEMQ
jgi:hypothetical protein